MKYARATSKYEVYTFGQRQRTRFVFETLKQVQLHLLSYYDVHKTYNQVRYAMKKYNNCMSLHIIHNNIFKIVEIKEL